MPEPSAPPAVEPLLKTTGLRLTAGPRVLLEGLDLTLSSAERLVVVGGNGSGKSTLLAVLAGLRAPDGGRVERPTDPPGVLFQDGALWPHMSVDDHLRFVDVDDDGAWRAELLQIFRLESLRRARPEQLSGGERLRLGLARALAPRPRWLLLDEPLAALDPEVAASVRETLPLLLDRLGAAVVLVTHDPDDVLLFGRQLLALSGRGPFWLGPARFALQSPPTAGLAAFSDRGTLLAGVVDAHGRADLGLGLALDGLPPGREVRAFLDASAVRLLGAAEDGRPACFAAPDRRGGSWVRVDGRLLRSRDGHGALRPGDPVVVRIEGAPRLLPEVHPT